MRRLLGILPTGAHLSCMRRHCPPSTYSSSVRGRALAAVRQSGIMDSSIAQLCTELSCVSMVSPATCYALNRALTMRHFEPRETTSCSFAAPLLHSPPCHQHPCTPS